MTDMVQLSSTRLEMTDNIEASEQLEVGQIIEGVVVDKAVDMTSIIIDQRIVELSGDVKVIEEVGEKLLLEVKKISEDSITLKYLNPNKPADDASLMPREVKKSLEIPKEYDKALIKAMKPLNIDEVKVVNDMLKAVQKDLTVLVDTITDVDIKAMLESDLNPEKLSIDLMTRIVKHNKQAIYSHDIQVIEEEVVKEVEAIKSKYKEDERLKVAVKILKESNMPVKTKHVDKIIETLDKIDTVKEVATDKWVNLLKQAPEGEAVSLKQAYKAINMPVSKDKVLDIPDKEIKMMVKEHLVKLDIPVTKATVEVATKMIKQGIDITPETIRFAVEPNEQIKPEPMEVVIKELVDLIKEQIPFERIEVIKAQKLTEVKDEVKEIKEVKEVKIKEETKEIKEVKEQTIDIKAKQLVYKLSQIKNEQIIVAASKYEELNLAKIFTESESDVSPEAIEIETKEAITAHRQIEEIRLKMTIEAAMKLEIKGLKIETEPLEKVVRELRIYEQEVTKEFAVVHDVKPTSENVRVATESLAKFKQLESMPEEALTKFIDSKVKLTIEDMSKTIEKVQEAHIIKLVQSVPLKAYETSGTEVRRDLGDRIEKTFDQIRPLLESLNIEPSKETIKAAQILARNEMPITPENVVEVQLVQQKVDYVTTRMSPHLVLEIIKGGINPVALSVDETMMMIEEFDQKFGETQPEKISRLFLELEHDGKITPVERESLMGIYRTFDTVVRSKGAATGFIVKNKLPLNMEKLFEAAKFIRKSKGIKPVVEADIDDDFGRLSHIEKSDKSIKELVTSALHEQKVVATREKVLAAMLTEMTIKSFVRELSHAGAKNQLVDKGVPEEVQTMPLKELEKVIKMSSESIEAQTSSGEKKAEIATVDTVLNFVKQSPELMKQLIKNEIPLTRETIQQAIELNKEPFTLLTSIRELVDSVDNQELKEQITHKISEASRDILEGGKSTQLLKEALKDIERTLLSHEESGVAQSAKVASAAVKVVNHTQMIQLTEDYYQIPVMMGDELSQLNMYILNNNEESLSSRSDSTKVIMSFSTHNLGRVSAYIEIEGNKMSMNLQSDHEHDLGILSGFETQIRDLMDSTNFTLSAIAYKHMEIKSPISTSQSSNDRTQIVETSSSTFEIVV